MIKWAAFYEHRCRTGSKVIFHLEAFVAKYMRIYERCVLFPPRLGSRLTSAVSSWVLSLTEQEATRLSSTDVSEISVNVWQEGVEGVQLLRRSASSHSRRSLVDVIP